MTFSTNVPNASQSPGLFPAQANTNWTRLKSLINAEHVFNDTAAVDDGVHKKVTMIAQSAHDILPAGTNAQLYTKVVSAVSQLFYWNGVTDFQLTPLRIVAAVNFDGTGGNGSKTKRSQFNVTTVTRTGIGTYTLTFTTPIVNANYIVQCTGMRTTAESCTGTVRGDSTYSNSVTAATLKVQFFGANQNTQDVIMGNVVVVSVE